MLQTETKKVETKEPTIEMAVYGTLRVSHRVRNTNWAGDIELLRNTTLEGYKMFDIGGLPMIMESNNPKDTIVVDVIKTTEKVAHRIARVELGAGYVQAETHDQPDSENNGLPIWVAGYRWSTRIEYRVLNINDKIKEIDSGDWAKYLRNSA